MITHAGRAPKNAAAHGDQVEFEHALSVAAPQEFDVIALDEALQDLAQLNRQHSDVVELRYFGGMTVEEVANVLGVSPRTVQRAWRMARAWLRREIFSHEYAGC